LRAPMEQKVRSGGGRGWREWARRMISQRASFCGGGRARRCGINGPGLGMADGTGAGDAGAG
jgi:hypothetical protein